MRTTLKYVADFTTALHHLHDSQSDHLINRLSELAADPDLTTVCLPLIRVIQHERRQAADNEPRT